MAQEEESDARLSGWPLRLRRILPALTCPACQGELKPSCDAVTCASCRERFPVRGGKIHFIESPAAVDDLDSIKRRLKNWLGNAYYSLGVQDRFPNLSVQLPQGRKPALPTGPGIGG